MSLCRFIYVSIIHRFHIIFITGNLSNFISGLIPVPVFPPDPSSFYQYSGRKDGIHTSSTEFSPGSDKRARELQVFDSIKVSCGAKIVLTNKLYR